MNIMYASRTGNVEKIILSLQVPATKISNSELANEDFILFTYTDGFGDIPKIVKEYLEMNHSHLKGVIVSGSMMRHAATFAFAGDKIAQLYHVPFLYKVDGAGNAEDIAKIKTILNSLA